MINVFIPHRWNNNDYSEISALLDRTKFNVRDYSVLSSSPFDSIDRRYNVDPQIQKQIKYAVSLHDLFSIAAKYICSVPTGSTSPTLSNNCNSLNTLTCSASAYGSIT